MERPGGGRQVRVLHICAGWEPQNGAANIARMIVAEQRRAGHEVSLATWAGIGALRAADEVWIHCAWKPCLWWAALWAKRCKWMPEASYDPLRLRFHGWKKRLVGPIERFFLRRAGRIVATCEAERGWVEAYLGRRCPGIEVTDIKRFFDLEGGEERTEGKVQGPEAASSGNASSLHVLYLGRRHPLKGLEYLEEAVGRHLPAVELRVVSDAFGEEKEHVWDWCDVLALPTLSENFGLVVAEALERGKRVITTDGAPAWEGDDYGGRLRYLVGYREGTRDMRVKLLKDAIESMGK